MGESSWSSEHRKCLEMRLPTWSNPVHDAIIAALAEIDRLEALIDEQHKVILLRYSKERGLDEICAERITAIETKLSQIGAILNPPKES